VAWSALALVALASLPDELALATLAIAVAFSALLLAHVAALSVRLARCRARGREVESVGGPSRLLRRKDFLVVAGRATGGAVLLTVMAACGQDGGTPTSRCHCRYLCTDANGNQVQVPNNDWIPLQPVGANQGKSPCCADGKVQCNDKCADFLPAAVEGLGVVNCRPGSSTCFNACP
jgi:hypothetical protein